MKKKKFKNSWVFWQNICVAAAQVNYGVIAAVWFLEPYNFQKALILIVNGIFTVIFVILGYNMSRKI